MRNLAIRDPQAFVYSDLPAPSTFSPQTHPDEQLHRLREYKVVFLLENLITLCLPLDQ